MQKSRYRMGPTCSLHSTQLHPRMLSRNVPSVINLTIVLVFGPFLISRPLERQDAKFYSRRLQSKWLRRTPTYPDRMVRFSPMTSSALGSSCPRMSCISLFFTTVPNLAILFRFRIWNFLENYFQRLQNLVIFPQIFRNEPLQCIAHNKKV